MREGKNISILQGDESILSCPVCGCKQVYPGPQGGIAYNAICANCRALLNITPFGVEVLADDAAEKHPKILDWWDKRNLKGLTGDKQKRKFGPAPNTPRFNPSRR